MRTNAAGTTMTVGELREALAGLDDNATIIVSDAEGKTFGDIVTARTGAFDVELTAQFTSLTDADRLAELEAFMTAITERTLGYTTAVSIRRKAEELS